MASARELLEQADALMRKNRTRGDADIPLLTEAVALVPVALDLPMSPPAVSAAPLAADVPVLTDAVADDVVDFAPRTEPPAALVAIMEGDPSDWLVMDTIDPASHSITGRAPNTLSAMPPMTAMTLRAAGSAATPPPAGSQPRPRVSPDQEPDWLGMPMPAAVTDGLHAAPPAPPPEPTQAPAPAPADAPESATARAAAPAPAPAPTPTPTPTTDMAESPAPTPLPPVVEDEPFEPASNGAVFEPPEDEPAPIQLLATAATMPLSPERTPSDDEHWRALSEQISMQVLQRLDLFTDSGLKEQLARRLQPIVDRASAELVSELTEHVGRLVRTYVSEAIEREIAQWKQDQR
jgi:hypothetical protein